MFSNIKSLDIVFKRDITQAYILLIVSVFIRYYIPKPIGDAYFLSILVMFFLSKKNFFWLAFIFLLIVPPGLLFSEYSSSYKLPSFGVPGFGRSITFPELFAFIAILKTINVKTKSVYFFSIPLYSLLIYLVFLIFLSFIIGISTYKIFHLIRYILPLSFFFSLPRILKNEDDFHRFFNLIFSFIPILVAVQLFELIGGRNLAYFLGETTLSFGDQIVTLDNINPYEETIRAIYGVPILLLGYILALFYISNVKSIFNKSYLRLIIILGLFAVILSATRTWIVSFSFMLFIFILINRKIGLLKLIYPVLFIFILSLIPVISTQIENALERTSTIKLLVEGDISAGNTVSRFTERGPLVMSKFWESPIIGWGFSEEYFKYQDGHVGHQTMLLNGGITGYLLFLFFWIYFIVKLYNKNKLLSRSNTNKNSLLVFIIGLGGMLIIHTTAMVFSYLTSVHGGLAIILFFVFADFAYKESSLEEVKNSIHKHSLPIKPL